jgi:hypothetical protein
MRFRREMRCEATSLLRARAAQCNPFLVPATLSVPLRVRAPRNAIYFLPATLSGCRFPGLAVADQF